MRFKPRRDWIIANQQKEVVTRYAGKVIWVNQCLRCGDEKPVYEGPLQDALSKSKDFIKKHQDCREK